MQVFQAVQKTFDWMGISPKLKPFNRITSSILAIVIPPYIFLWIFLLHDADNSQEYMESSYAVMTCTGMFLSSASTILIKRKLFSFIDSFDELVNESKLNFNH